MAIQVPVNPREKRRARNVGWATTIVSGVLVALLVYLGYAAWVGSERLVDPTPSAVCRLPSAHGWAYDAINYDRATDAALAAEPDPDHCASVGQPAGTALTASDGTRLAGWYIPASSAAGSAGPTVILVHGHGQNKNTMLPWATLLHDSYNLVLYDQRNSGQSFGEATTVGVRERQDLAAVVAWLTATHAPSSVAVLGVSMGGIVAASAMGAGLPVDAVVLDSTPASIARTAEREIARMGYPLALPAAWAVMLGTLFRTGVDVTAADPLLHVDQAGSTRVLIIQGDADQLVEPDAAEQLAAEAQAAGVPVEVHRCPGADHGQAIEVCADAYRGWVLGFLAR